MAKDVVRVGNIEIMALSDGKLTYFHEGRFKQLSQIGGQVIRELLA